MTLKSDNLSSQTPMMLQWRALKERSKGAILLFRLGEFYEAFAEDAEILSKALDIVLTARQGIPMSGIPAIHLDEALATLTENGHLVAVAEQKAAPSDGKGITERDLVGIFSAATLPQMGSDFKASLLLALYENGGEIGLASVDFSTGELSISQHSNEKQEWIDALFSKNPRELLLSSKLAKKHEPLLTELKASKKIKIHVKGDWEFDKSFTEQKLQSHFKVHSIEALGLSHLAAASQALGALLVFLKEELHRDISHLSSLSVEKTEGRLIIDRSTLRHLEITQAQHLGSKSLFELLDLTQSAMGHRELRNWVISPLDHKAAILARQEAVSELLECPALLLSLRESFFGISDIARLATRAKTALASPRDLRLLGESLGKLPSILHALKSAKSPWLSRLCQKMRAHESIASLLLSSLRPDAKAKLSTSPTIAAFIDPTLDTLRDFSEKSKEWLSSYEKRLKEELSIKTLKVDFSRAFGYFIEVSRGQADKMPEGFTRRQTLVNAERFISEELKNFETRALTVEADMAAREMELFLSLREEVAKKTQELVEDALSLGKLDAILSLAEIARRGKWQKPTLSEDGSLEIQGGLHPLLALLGKKELVANDLSLSKKEHLLILTGPNMAGKSTYLRMCALLALLTQIGSFLPVKSATMPLFDRLFSRIGAHDDLSQGASTFMVEMTETAAIIHGVTERSLIILDEIGRGTSSADGIAIAWAVAEYLANHPKKISPKVLFATHFSELSALAESFSKVKLSKVAIHEMGDEILCTHKVVSGVTDKSYGLFVAKRAGLPLALLAIAKRVQDSFPKRQKESSQKAPLPSCEEKILPLLKKLDLDSMTPLQAMQTLAQWKNLIN